MNSTVRPFVIPVFLPNIGCPHTCTFCNQVEISGVKSHIPSGENLGQIIKTFLGYKKNRHPVQISFYGGNFLGLPKKNITALLEKASRFVEQRLVDTIRFSTRPDTINKENLDLIKDFPVSTVEIGAQSMDDHVLALAHRGHTSLDTEKSAVLLKQGRYEVGIQMMIGLPGDTDNRALATAEKLAVLYPDFVRIYPTLVLKNSNLENQYRESKYQPLNLEHAVSLTKKLYLFFQNRNIRVIRMGLQANTHLSKENTVLAGPYHPAFGHLVYSAIFLDLARSALESKKSFSNDSIVIKVHPHYISALRGLNNRNIIELKNRFQVQTIHVLPDPTLQKLDLLIE